MERDSNFVSRLKYAFCVILCDDQSFCVVSDVTFCCRSINRGEKAVRGDAVAEEHRARCAHALQRVRTNRRMHNTQRTKRRVQRLVPHLQPSSPLPPMTSRVLPVTGGWKSSPDKTTAG